MDGFKKDRYEIKLMRRAYAVHIKRIRDARLNIRRCSREKYEMSITMVNRIHSAVEFLDGEERFIIENEVLLGKEGKWFLAFFSSSKYYRCRRKAYRNFLRCL